MQEFRQLRCISARFILSGICGSQYQLHDPPRIVDSQLLGNHTAHGKAHNMGFLDPQNIHELYCIVGHHPGGIRARRLVRLAGSPIIKGNYSVIFPEEPSLGQPANSAGGESHYHHERFTLSFYLIANVNTIKFGQWHAAGPFFYCFAVSI